MRVPIFDNKYGEFFGGTFATEMPLPKMLPVSNPVIPVIPKVKKGDRPGLPEGGGDLVGIPTEVPVAPEIPTLEPVVVMPNAPYGENYADTEVPRSWLGKLSDGINSFINRVFFETKVDPNNSKVQQIQAQNGLFKEMTGVSKYNGQEAFEMAKGFVGTLPATSALVDLETATNSENSGMSRIIAGVGLGLGITVVASEMRALKFSKKWKPTTISPDLVYGCEEFAKKAQKSLVIYSSLHTGMTNHSCSVQT